MKHKKVFLGITAFLLTIAGVSILKGNRKLAPILAGTKGLLGDACTNIDLRYFTTIEHNGFHVAHTANGIRTFYTAHFKVPSDASYGYTCGKILYTFSDD